MPKSLPLCASIAALAIGWWLGMPAERAGISPKARTVESPRPAVALETASTSQADTAGTDAFHRLAEDIKPLKSVAEVWALALEELELLPPSTVGAVARAALAARHWLTGNLFDYWTEVDLPGARIWLEGLSKAHIRQGAQPVVGTWVKMNPNSYLDWLEQLPKERKNEFTAQTMYLLVKTAAIENPERLLALLRDIPQLSNSGGSEFSDVFRAWAKKDAPRAAKEALALADVSARSANVEAVVTIWTLQDPAGALRWVTSLDDAKLSARAMARYANALSDKDPKAAMEFVSNLPLTERNQKLMTDVARSWSLKSPTEAFAWIHSLEDEEARSYVLGQVLNVLAHREPDRAADEIAQTRDHFEINSECLRLVGLHVLGTKGPAGLGAYAEKLPEDLAREMFREVVPHWLSEDAKAFTTWSTALPEGPLRTQVYREWGAQQVLKDLPGAIAWAKALPVTDSNKPGVLKVAKAAFYQNAGGVEMARRVAPPEEVSSLLEDWVQPLIEENPDSVRRFLEKTDALSAPAKKRIRARLDAAKE